jgi:hypothetical protein
MRVNILLITMKKGSEIPSTRFLHLFVLCLFSAGLSLTIPLLAHLIIGFGTFNISPELLLGG